MNNDNDGITKTGGEMPQFINALNNAKNTLLKGQNLENTDIGGQNLNMQMGT